MCVQCVRVRVCPVRVRALCTVQLHGQGSVFAVSRTVDVVAS